MNKNDYEEIAKIIKKNTAPTENQFNDLSVVGECLIEDLIDYFGKEDEKEYWRTHNPKYDVYVKYRFNKQQFIKDCG